MMCQRPPGYCVECFMPLYSDEIICDRCQAELDGELDFEHEYKGEQ